MVNFQRGQELDNHKISQDQLTGLRALEEVLKNSLAAAERQIQNLDSLNADLRRKRDQLSEQVWSWQLRP